MKDTCRLMTNGADEATTSADVHRSAIVADDRQSSTPAFAVASAPSWSRWSVSEPAPVCGFHTADGDYLTHCPQ
jgi:hypothetical protein